MFVGAPCIYYGTEILLEGGYDPDNRRCFDWEEEHWDQDFGNQLRKLLSLRQNGIVESGGISTMAKGDLFVLSRYSDEGELVLVANQSGEKRSVSLRGEVLLENHFHNEEESGKGPEKIQGNLETDGFLIFKGSKDEVKVIKEVNEVEQ